MASEIKPVTYIRCHACGHRIALYDEPYVVVEIRKGGQLLSHQDLCVECAPK